MLDVNGLLQKTADIIADYRLGEIPKPNAGHVKKWLDQFDKELRPQLLSEISHVLEKTYISRDNVEKFLASLVTNPKLTEENPKNFWRKTKLMNIQTRGSSQREFLSLFSVPLKKETGLSVGDCGSDKPNRFVYLDDGLYTGITILNGLASWLKKDAPPDAVVDVITIALHKGGQFYAQTKLEEIARAAGKNVKFNWWRLVELEDRKAHVNNSDVLRPKTIPDDESVKKYAASLGFPPALRTGDSVGELKLFSSPGGRDLLEQQLLRKGAHIRDMSPYLPVFARPLGNMVLQTLGFGSTIVTYRNCPNNAPLAFWAGDPWYPLFPRKTN